MFRLFSVIVLLCCVIVPLYSEEVLIAESTLKNVLIALNLKNESSFVYSLPSATNKYNSWKNDSLDSSVTLLELRLDKCDDHSSCVEEHVICELHSEGNVTEVVSCSEKEGDPHFSSRPGYNQEISDHFGTKSKTAPEKSLNSEFSDSFVDISARKQVESHPEEHFTVDDFNIEKYLESLIETDDKPERDEDSAEKYIGPGTGEFGSTESVVEFNTVEPRPVVEEPVVAKKAFCLGCPVDLNVNNPDLTPFIDQALKSVDESTMNLYKHGLVKLHKAQRQVVNGILYMLLLDVGETTCVKESNTDRNNCSLNLKTEPSTCYIEIFEKPGLGKERRVSYNNCTGIVHRLPTNEIIPASPGLSIFNTENVPSNSDTEGRFQPGSLDGMVTASAHENVYNYAGDYVEDSDIFPFPGLDIENYFSDPAEYYYMKQNVRMKRAGHSAFIGMLKEIGPEEKDMVDELAAIALETLDNIDDDDLKRVVVEVVDAKKQIMSGVMYHLKVVVGTTSCDENQPVASACLQEFVLPLSVCVIQLHQSFIDNSPRVQVVKSECGPKEEGKAAETFNSRNMKDSFSSDSDVQAISPQMLKVSAFALSKINKKLNSVHKLVDIVNIHTEVQDDIKTYISLKIAPCAGENKENSDCLPNYTEGKLCKAEIIEQVCGTPVQLLNFSCTGTEDPRKQEVHKLLGALSPAEVDDPYITNIAHTSLTELDRRSNSLYRHKLIKILSAETQVVAGRLVKLRMEMGYGMCQQENDNSAEECTLRKDLGTQICDIKVWDRPWLKERQINQISCLPVAVQRKKRSIQNRRLVGAPGQIEAEDPDVKNVLAFAVAELDKQTDSNFKRKAVKVLDAKVQVVAGVLYHFTVEISDTMCLKEAPQSVEECDVNDSSRNQICKVKVLVQAWRKHHELTSSQCSEKTETIPEAQPESRRKRAILPYTSKQLSLGGLKKIEKDHEAFMDIASFALHEIDRASNSARRKKIIKILNIQSQIVEGVKYYLDMEVSDTNCLKRTQHPIENCDVTEDLGGQICHVEVWERPWLNIRKVTKMSCTVRPRKNLLNNGEMNREEQEIHLGIFRDFMSKYNKTYKNNEEMQQRFNIFKHNLARIELLQKTERGTGKYGITQFADLTAKEFKQKYLGLNRALRRENEIPMAQAQIPDIELPVEFDWRHYNVVTPVKNQGACGSCWAFSVTGNVEGQWAIHQGELLSLSEQELVDCDTLDSGCEGGLPDNAYRAIEKLGGLETERNYPYEGEDEKCHFNKSEVRVKIQGAVNITSNETKMAQWLVKNGPISIGINANAMQFYVGGVSHPWKFLCDPDDLDHGVLIVGYGVHKTYFRHKILPYWIVKNSWGTFWGEKGYYRVYRGDGTCGVNLMASSAVVD